MRSGRRPYPRGSIRIAQPHFIQFILLDQRLFDPVRPAPAATRPARPAQGQIAECILFAARMHWQQGAARPAAVLDFGQNGRVVSRADRRDSVAIARIWIRGKRNQPIVEKRDRCTRLMTCQRLDLGSTPAP